MMERTDLLRPADIAKLAHVDSSTVANWRRRHDDFPAPSQGTDRMFDRESVVHWLRQRGMLPDSDPIGALRASGLRDPEALALELAAIAAVLEGTDGLSSGESLPSGLVAAIGTATSDAKFTAILAEAIAHAQRRWASSGSTEVPLFPLLSTLSPTDDRTSLIRELIPDFAGSERWETLAAALPTSGTQFAQFVADTIPAPEIGHVIDMAAGTGETILEVGVRRSSLTLSAIVDGHDAVRGIALRAIARGISIRVISGDLATAEAMVEQAAPDIILSSAEGRVGATSIRSYTGGLLSERDYGLAALIAASRWLAPGGFAAVATDRKAVSDLPEYLRLARDLVLGTEQIASIIALPEDFRGTLPILWILEQAGGHRQVITVDARKVSASDDADLEETKGAARYGWSSNIGTDPDYLAWHTSPGAANPWMADLIGPTATVEPGYWAPPEGYVDWEDLRDHYRISSRKAGLYLRKLREPLDSFTFRRFRGGLPGAKAAKVRLGMLEESNAVSLERGPSVDDQYSRSFTSEFDEYLAFQPWLWGSSTIGDGPGIARQDDVILALDGGVLRAAVIEHGQPIRVGRKMWIVRLDTDIVDPKYLAMTINSAWGQRISRLVDPAARNDPRRIELALIDINAQRELGIEYRRLTRFQADLALLSSEVTDALEHFSGIAATGEDRVGGPMPDDD